MRQSAQYVSIGVLDGDGSGENRRIEHDTEDPILIDHLLQVAGDYEVAMKIVVPEALTLLTQLDIRNLSLDAPQGIVRQKFFIRSMPHLPLF